MEEKWGIYKKDTQKVYKYVKNGQRYLQFKVIEMNIVREHFSTSRFAKTEKFVQSCQGCVRVRPHAQFSRIYVGSASLESNLAIRVTYLNTCTP